MSSTPDLAYQVALSQVPGIGAKTLEKLLQQAGSFYAVWAEPRRFLNPNNKLFATLTTFQQQVVPETLYQSLMAQGISILAWGHPGYPERLTELYDPPMVLYVRGSVQALSLPRMLAVVGNRQVSPYGQQVVDFLIGGLSGTQGCIVSGLARGVDGLAHQAALKAGLPTVAVFGCGIDVIYPSSHKGLAQAICDAGGALVSEYPPGLQPTKYTFPARNRIVSGLSQGVLVVEGGVKSGSLITAELAVEENRPVFAVPGNIFHPGAQGPLKLIQEGALPVMTPVDLTTALGWSPNPSSERRSGESQSGECQSGQQNLLANLPELPASLADPLALALLKVLTLEPMLLESVFQQLEAYSPQQIQQTLVLLELEGYVEQLPGAQVLRLPR